MPAVSVQSAWLRLVFRYSDVIAPVLSFPIARGVMKFQYGKNRPSPTKIYPAIKLTISSTLMYPSHRVA